jgi:hypothetical protein
LNRAGFISSGLGCGTPRGLFLFKKEKRTMKSGDKCECGGTLKTPEELGLDPERVVSNSGWAWQLKEALICDTCGGHYLLKENPD